MDTPVEPAHSIIALIGPNGAGKRTLTLRMTELFNAKDADQLRVLPICTTRDVASSPFDQRFFTRLSEQQFENLRTQGSAVDATTHQSAWYGYSRTSLDLLLQWYDVIAPMRATSAVRLRELGYTVHVVRIVARDAGNRCIHASDGDGFQRSFALRPDMTVVNQFTTKGLSLATNHLAYLVTVWTGREYPGDSEIPNAM
jgi:hypothetical protein